MVVVASRDIGAWITTALVRFMVLLSLLNLIAVTQDIATDGLAVSRRALRLHGFGNSVQARSAWWWARRAARAGHASERLSLRHLGPLR